VPNAVVITWQISFDQIKTQDPSAAQLLSRMSVLDRQGIPAFLFYHDDNDRLGFDDAVGTLVGFSFVTAQKDENTYVMHRLVQLSMRTWLDVHGEIVETRGHMLDMLASEYPDGDHADWKICESLEPHAEMLFRNEYLTEEYKLHLAQVLHNRAWHAWARGEYATAQKRAEAAFTTKKLVLGINDENTVASLGMLAIILNSRGKYEQAEEMNRQLLRQRETMLGKEHPSTLTSMNNLALVLKVSGQVRAGGTDASTSARAEGDGCWAKSIPTH
jgi:tetratricopeptide (TPR) repeat protein